MPVGWGRGGIPDGIGLGGAGCPERKNPGGGPGDIEAAGFTGGGGVWLGIGFWFRGNHREIISSFKTPPVVTQKCGDREQGDTNGETPGWQAPSVISRKIISTGRYQRPSRAWRKPVQGVLERVKGVIFPCQGRWTGRGGAGEFLRKTL